jgi:hypothetical protein
VDLPLAGAPIIVINFDFCFILKNTFYKKRDAQKEGIKFDRVKYVTEELKIVKHYYTDIMTMEQFFKAMERNEKLENLGI